MMTADIRKVLDFARQVEAGEDSEQIISLCIEHGVGYIHDPSYDMFAGRSEEEKREWHVFMLFLVKAQSGYPDAAAMHTEWVLQRPFQNVAEWMGEEGDKFRRGWGNGGVMGSKVKSDWALFAAEHASKSLSEIEAELNELHRERGPAPPPPVQRHLMPPRRRKRR